MTMFSTASVMSMLCAGVCWVCGAGMGGGHRCRHSAHHVCYCLTKSHKSVASVSTVDLGPTQCVPKGGVFDMCQGIIRVIDGQPGTYCSSLSKEEFF